MKIRPFDRQPTTGGERPCGAAAAPLFAADRAHFDAEKVMRIAQAIRDGSFTVDAEAIADKLLANMAAERRGRSLH